MPGRGRSRRPVRIPPELRKFCTKRRYDTEEDAADALASARREHEGTGRKIEKRYYQCTDCKKWHLTSRADPPKRAGRDR